MDHLASIIVLLLILNSCMLGRNCVFLSFVLLAGTLYAAGQDTSSGDTIKIDTRLVSVPVIVSDRNGRYISGLSQKDFQIFQDGSEQKIDLFTTADEPINVALLIDTSQSTRGVLGDIKDSARAFIKLLGPQDKAMIVSFDYDTHILSPLVSDQDQLKHAIKQAEIPDRLFGTTMRDAVFQTVTRSFKGVVGRKAIILLTDGKDAGSRISTSDLIYRLEETDTLIYTVMFKTDERQMILRQIVWGGRGGGFPGGRFPGGRNGRRFPDNDRFPNGGRRGGGFPPIDRGRDRIDRENANAQSILQRLSDITAGRSYSSKDGKLKSLFALIVEELRLQYRLGFYPPDDNKEGLHTIKVRISRPDAAIRYRGSYRTQSKTN